MRDLESLYILAVSARYHVAQAIAARSAKHPVTFLTGADRIYKIRHAIKWRLSDYLPAGWAAEVRADGTVRYFRYWRYK